MDLGERSATLRVLTQHLDLLSNPVSPDAFAAAKVVQKEDVPKEKRTFFFLYDNKGRLFALIDKKN